MNTTPQPSGAFVDVDGLRLFRIDDVDAMRPFLATLVGVSDAWCFLSSSGGLTAGRATPDRALLPYETEDRLHRGPGHSGVWTSVSFDHNGERVVWRPFVGRAADGVRRSIAKTPFGDVVVFEEVHERWGLSLRSTWGLSDRYGVVRRVVLTRSGSAPRHLRVQDGFRDLLPPGISRALQESASVLATAYKQSELLEPGRLGVFSLTAGIVDRAEPAESLDATVAWCAGLPGGVALIGPSQQARWDDGLDVVVERRLHAQRCDFVVCAEVEFDTSVEWTLGADTGLDRARVLALGEALVRDDFAQEVARSLDTERRELRALLARSDAETKSADETLDARHASNTLFNCMRGGVPPSDTLDVDDLRRYLDVRSTERAPGWKAFLEALPDGADLQTLHAAADATGDADLRRLCREYLPLTFGRRHGDPSRPWNRFHIRVRDEHGHRRLAWEGNWRDVFQNWEALCLSFPVLLPGAIHTFLNASTADGFNPYRVSHEGIDWEVPEPESEWANLGYWGDHQVVYLLRLLEAARDHGAKLVDDIDAADFVWADVPYRLAGFDALVADPHHTIDFDDDRARAIDQRVARSGADGRLRHEGDALARATLGDKLLTPLLGRLGSFVPGGGVWMNTQRPEWNDANNALVGHGVSMVTAAYTRRYVSFLSEWLDDVGRETVRVREATATWFAESVAVVLASGAGAAADPARAHATLAGLGRAFERHRRRVYDGTLGAWSLPRVDDLRRGLAAIAALLDETLAHGRRPDGLFDAYGLLDLRTSGRAEVERLYPMLEGQVAMLSTNRWRPDEVCAVLDALRASGLYRADQHSYLLYPARELPAFIDRGVVPSHDLARAPILGALIAAGDRSVVVQAADGTVSFAPGLAHAGVLRERLAAAGARGAVAVDSHDIEAALAVYEQVFHHRAFTGRSGTMHAYEGLGCIYWHMVSKLLVAVQEQFWGARDAGATQSELRELAARYHDVRDGLGFRRSVASNGAFPTDAYSHTGPDGSARQPGMTGQVKEDLLTRRGELGIRLRRGRLSFEPALLHPRELLSHPTTWRRANGADIALDAGELGATVAGTAVVLRVGGADTIAVTDAGHTARFDGTTLDVPTTRRVMARGGDAIIRVQVPRETLLLWGEDDTRR